MGAALRDAQREAIRDGLPAAAWAGLVAVGDGSLVPLPADETGARDPRAVAAGVIAVTAAVVWALLRVCLRRPS